LEEEELGEDDTGYLLWFYSLVIEGVLHKARRDSIKTDGKHLFHVVQPSDEALTVYVLKMYVEQAQVQVYEQLGETDKSPMDEAASSSGTSAVSSHGKPKGRTDKRGRTRPLAEKKIGDVKSGKVGVANVFKRSNLEYYQLIVKQFKNMRLDMMEGRKHALDALVKEKIREEENKKEKG
jgi:hypothetical protein